MKKRLRVALLFGGKSAEHEISLISARNVAAAMDKKKYHVIAIAIDKQGRWYFDEQARLLRDSRIASVEPGKPKSTAGILPGVAATPLIGRQRRGARAGIDVVFPILHGPLGE